MTQDPQTGQQDLLVSASILRKIDKLRERNIGKHVPLPQVCHPQTPSHFLLTDLLVVSSSSWATKVPANRPC